MWYQYPQVLCSYYIFCSTIVSWKETSCELGEAEGIIKDMKEFEPEQVAAFKTKTDFLNEELKKAERNICTKIEILTTYVAFLKSSLEV